MKEMNFSKLKDCLDRIVKEYGAPGNDCSVYQGHEEIFRYYTGMRDIENKIRVNGDELYIIFSMTKMLTCTCALQLFEQGKFQMEDYLHTYLPEFKEMQVEVEQHNELAGTSVTSGKTIGETAAHGATKTAQNPITIKNLFTMCAGLDYDLNSDGIKEALKNGQTSTRELVRAISKKALGFEPGTRYRYSLCHDVIGALIEVWSGMKFGDYMKKNLLDPLGMKDTFFGVPEDEDRRKRMAARYKYGEDKKPERMTLECPYNLSKEYESGGAGLISSTEDYILFLDALANGGVGKSGARILKQETVELMQHNHLSGQAALDFDKMRPGYGYGLGVRTHINPEVSHSPSPIGEFGWDGAAGAFSLVDTKNKLSMVYFQEIHGWSIQIQEELKNALYESLIH